MSRFADSLLRAGTVALCLLFPTGLAAQNHDLTGTWEFTVTSPNGTGTRTVVLVQQGDSISGTIASSRASGDVAGTVEGDHLSFSVMLMMESGPFPVTYEATVSGDGMVGTVDFGDYGAGTFTGKRAAPADAGDR